MSSFNICPTILQIICFVNVTENSLSVFHYFKDFFVHHKISLVPSQIVYEYRGKLFLKNMVHWQVTDAASHKTVLFIYYIALFIYNKYL